MKILLVIDALGASGGERQLLSLLPGLRAQGIETEIAALMAPYTLATDFERLGVRVHRINIPHRWALLHGLARLRRAIVKGKFDALWATLYFAHVHAAMVGAVMPGLPLILWHQSPGYTNPVYRGVWPSIRAAIHGLACRRAYLNVACSKAVAEDFEQVFSLPKMPVIYNAVPPESLPGPIDRETRESIRSLYGVADNEFLLTIAARLSRDKGHHTLIEALGMLSGQGARAICVAAGDGPLEPELRAHVNRKGLGGSVLFVGSLPQPELFRLMQSSDAVVLPSVQESLGLAAIEAMAIGTPTVLTNYYGLAELAADGAAFTAPAGDAAKLAEAIRSALHDRQMRGSVISVARERVTKKFIIHAIIPKWAAVLRTAVGQYR